MATPWLPTTIYSAGTQVTYVGSIYTSSQNFNLNQIPDEDNSLWWSRAGGALIGVVAGDDIVLTGPSNLPTINVSAGATRTAFIADLPIPGRSSTWFATYTSAFDGPSVASRTLFCFKLFMYVDVPIGGPSFAVNWVDGVDRMLCEIWTATLPKTYVTSAVFVSAGSGLLPVAGFSFANPTNASALYPLTIDAIAPAGPLEMRVTVLNRSEALVYPTGTPVSPTPNRKFTSMTCTAVPLAG